MPVKLLIEKGLARVAQESLLHCVDKVLTTRTVSSLRSKCADLFDMVRSCAI
jgi:hypothetical protein